VSRILVAVAVVVALVGVGVAAAWEIPRAVRESNGAAAERALDERAVPVGGRTVTCAELFPEGCNYDLQFAFDRWGGQLDPFLASDLGPWGRGVAPAQAVKLGLEACNTARIPGQTFLEYLDLAQAERPEASSAQLFPFWHEAQRVLCPAG